MRAELIRLRVGSERRVDEVIIFGEVGIFHRDDNLRGLATRAARVHCRC